MILSFDKRETPALMIIIKLMLAFLFVLFSNSAASQNLNESRLARAVEYFQSGKYHEALLLFETLNKEFQLNPRFIAYLGVCYFYEKNYKDAANTFLHVLPLLENFAPHERSVYFYCAAESNYQLANYIESIGLFERQSLLCYDNECGDAFFRIGECYNFLGNIENSKEYFLQAIAYYSKFNTKDKLHKTKNEMKKLGINKNGI